MFWSVIMFWKSLALNTGGIIFKVWSVLDSFNWAILSNWSTSTLTKGYWFIAPLDFSETMSLFLNSIDCLLFLKELLSTYLELWCLVFCYYLMSLFPRGIDFTGFSSIIVFFISMLCRLRALDISLFGTFKKFFLVFSLFYGEKWLWPFEIWFCPKLFVIWGTKSIDFTLSINAR